MIGRSLSSLIRAGLVGFVCMIVFLGIAIGDAHFSKWQRQSSFAQAAASAEDKIQPMGVSTSTKDYPSDLEQTSDAIGPMNADSISSSTITTKQCYQEGKTWTICFTVHNGSEDNEWLDFVRLTFPDFPGLGAWGVACNSQDLTDTNGGQVNLDCSINGGKEVVFVDNDVEVPTPIGEISTGSSWSFCVDVTVPAGYTGPRIINWALSGDEEPGSNPPHDIDGQLILDQCLPLMLTPDLQQASGCNAIQQTFDLELWNNSLTSGQIDLNYLVPSELASIDGPTNFFMNPGDTVTFTVALTPAFNTKPGQIVTANVEAIGIGEYQLSTIAYTISSLAGWQRQVDVPQPTMDNAVAWAVQDGGLWSIGGYDSDGLAQRYTPDTGIWITYTNPLTPVIAYPMDGCYGLDEDDHEVIVLFPDTIVTNTLQRFDITDKTWDEILVPVGYHLNGLWAQDIVSMYNVTSFLDHGSAKNICYLSGGSTMTGGGRVKNLWEYHPDQNITIFLGNFGLHQAGFAFHASWYVPWIGDAGSICVAGGIDFESGVLADSECYDIQAASFRGENVDLGPLPEPWWGMADGWQIYDGEYQIWLANGVAQNGTLLPISAYASETSGGFHYGPGLSEGLYRMEGDGWNGMFYTLGGARGGFSYSNYNFLLQLCPICYEVFAPLLIK